MQTCSWCSRDRTPLGDKKLDKLAIQRQLAGLAEKSCDVTHLRHAPSQIVRRVCHSETLHYLGHTRRTSWLPVFYPSYWTSLMKRVFFYHADKERALSLNLPLFSCSHIACRLKFPFFPAAYIKRCCWNCLLFTAHPGQASGTPPLPPPCVCPHIVLCCMYSLTQSTHLHFFGSVGAVSSIALKKNSWFRYEIE